MFAVHMYIYIYIDIALIIVNLPEVVQGICDWKGCKRNGGTGYRVVSLDVYKIGDISRKILEWDRWQWQDMLISTSTTRFVVSSDRLAGKVS